MKAKTYKRFLAYVLDILILSIIFMLIYYFLPTNYEVQELNHSLASINEQVLNNQIEFNEYFNMFSQVTYQLDKANILYSGFNILLVCIYFVIVPVLTEGYTLGLYIFGLKITKKDKKISINDLLIRNLITNGLLYMIISLILVSLVNAKTYFIMITILGFIQILLVIISTFMILYRKDKRGLQDIISKTTIEKN